MLAVLPFSGFYESIHDAAITDAVDQFFMDDSGDILAPDDFFLYFDFKKAMEPYAIEYIKAYRSHVASELDADLSKMNFESLSTPSFFNFGTNIIYVNIPEDVVKALLDLDVVKANLPGVIRDQFTSRPGFVSFYPNSIFEWPVDIGEWDHNQVGAVLKALCDEDIDLFDNSERISELVYNSLSDECKIMVDSFDPRVAA